MKTVLTLLLALVFLDKAPAAIDSIGIYKGIYVIKEGDQYLLVSGVEDTIALADAKGRIVAVYNKKGDGPEDIKVPIYLGRYQNSSIFLSHWNRLLAFDKNLVPTMVGKLDERQRDTTLYLGMNQGKDWYWIYRGFSKSPDLVVSVRPRTGSSGFDILKTFHRQPRGNEIPGLPFGHQNLIWIHNNRAFKTDNAVIEDQYEVTLLSNLTGSQADMVLVGDVASYADWFKDRPAKAGVNAAFIFADGFLVRFTAKVKSTQKLPDPYMDAFDARGAFKKRLQGGEELLPCVNCSYAYEYREEDDKYRRIDSVAAWLALHKAP